MLRLHKTLIFTRFRLRETLIDLDIAVADLSFFNFFLASGNLKLARNGDYHAIWRSYSKDARFLVSDADEIINVIPRSI